MKKSFLLVLLLSTVSTGGAVAQSLTGITGLLNAPSANMLENGTFYTGANYLNRNYINYYGKGRYNCLIYYFDLTFLPFMEINFRNTRMLNNPDSMHTVDRMFSGKIRLLKERKYWPSIVVGGNDVISTSSAYNEYFGAAYIVVTKNFEIKRNLVGGTLGYAYPLFTHSQFSGIFGGIAFSPSFFRQLTVMAEYDSRNFNIGASGLFFKHLYIFALLQGMESISGGISFRFSVYSGFKSIARAKRKSE
jgi:hypothetical protein